MKRRLLFLLMLPLALGLWAQTGDYDQTYLIGRLAFQGEILQGTMPLMGFEPQSIAVQAFVAGVPSSDPTLPTWRGTADEGFFYYELPVINTTEADLAGEEIEVRLLLGDYALGLATGLTYTGTTTTYGSLSQPVLFNVVTPSVVSPLQIAENKTVALDKNISKPAGFPTIYNKEGEAVALTALWTFVTDEGPTYLSLNAETGELTSLKLTGDDTPVLLHVSFAEFPGCDQTLEVYVMASPVEGMTINEGAAFPEVMYVGRSYPLTNDYVVFEPVYATDQSLTWSVSDPDMVTIQPGDDPDTFNLVPTQTGTITITATSNGNPDFSVSWTVKVESLIERIELNEQSVTIETGEQLVIDSFLAGYYPEDATLNELAWTSDNESVAKITLVDGKYVVTGVSDGTATLTLYSVANPSAQTQLTVTVIWAVNTFTVVSAEQYVYLNDRVDLSYEIAPSGAESRQVVWTCSDPDAVSITTDETSGETQITMVQLGDFTLTGTPDDGKHVDYIVVHVVSHVGELALSVTDPLMVNVGENLSLEGLVTFTPADAYNKEVIWTSSDESIALPMQEDGQWSVRGESKGTALLTVASADNPDAKATIQIIVIAPIQEIVIEVPNQIVFIGESVDLSWHVVPENASIDEAYWTSSDESIVTVNEDGEALAVDNGQATLTLYVNGEAAGTITVEVRSHVDTLTLINADDLSVNVGETLSLSDIVKIEPADAYNKNVVWTIADGTVASLSGSGSAWSVTGLAAGVTVLTVASEDNSALTATVTLTVVQPVIGITVNISDIQVPLGEQQSLEGAITVQPAGASVPDVVWTSSNPEVASIVYDETTDTYYVQGNSEGETTIVVTTVDGAYSAEIQVVVYVPDATSIVVDDPSQTVVIGQEVNLSFTISPANADQQVIWTSSDPSIVKVEIIDGQVHATAISAGNAVLTVTTVHGGQSATINVTVVASKIERFAFSATTFTTTKDAAPFMLTLTPTPADIVPDVKKLEIVTSDIYGLGKGWKYLEIDEPLVNKDGTVEITVSAAYSWGHHSFEVLYDGEYMGSVAVSVEAILDFSDGWNWISLPDADYEVHDVEAAGRRLGGNVQEIRTQFDLLALDPVYGYFGTIESLTSDVCYKIDFAKSPVRQTVGVVSNGAGNRAYNLMKGWNWMAYPYEYTYSLEELVGAGVFAESREGDMLVGLDAFAVYDGTAWSGSLTTLTPMAGYMYHAASNDMAIHWNGYAGLMQHADVDPVRASTLRANSHLWSYRANAYADNMAIIACVDGLDLPAHCSIGAYVGDECRGQGWYVDGQFFITVHGEAGEQVSFIIRDEQNDSWYTVKGTLSFCPMAGTLTSPVRLTRGEQTTAVRPVEGEDSQSEETVVYDLTGRRVVHPVSGIYIINNQKVLINE